MEGMVLLLGAIILYSLSAAWIGKFSITMPMVFVGVGILTSPQVLGLVTFSISHQDIELLTEITLALLLFSDASTLDFRRVRDDRGLPARLLLIGLPLIMIFGSVVAFFLFRAEGIGLAFLLGAILAPTDAALGLPIFNNPRVPVRIRRALNVESGLNDGIATPFVTLFTALALTYDAPFGSGVWIRSALMQLIIGTMMGLVSGLLGGRLFITAFDYKLTSKLSEQIGNIALALFAFLGSEALGGNGFIAAFVAGIIFGYSSRNRLHEATEFTETLGTLFSLFVWTIFGANLVAPLFLSFHILPLLYAVLSLTIVRMIPVAVALIGAKLRPDTVIMMGWLGPRGLASVVFTLIAFESFHEAGVDAEIIVDAAVWTILLSVLLHGISAAPLANWYAKRLEKGDQSGLEFIDLEELPGRHRRGTVPLGTPEDLT